VYGWELSAAVPFSDVLAKVVKAASRHEAASYLRQTYGASERHAGRTLGLGNSRLHYRSRRPAAEDLRRRLRELAAERPCYGYQRLWALLRREDWKVNHKRVYRLYHEEGLKLRKRRRRSRVHVGTCQQRFSYLSGNQPKPPVA